MRKMSFVLFTVLVFLIPCHKCLSQPYLYYSGNTVDSAASFTKKEIMRLDLKTGSQELFLYNGFEDFLTDPLQMWLATGFSELGYKIYSTQDTTISFNLPSDLVPEDILPPDTSGNIYFFCETNESNNLFKELARLNTKTGVTDSVLTIPEIADANDEAFFSLDKSTIYFTMPDTNFNWSRADKMKIVFYSTLSGRITKEISLSEIGKNNADGYKLYRDAYGHAVLKSYIKNSTKDSYFRVYNFDVDSGSNSILFHGYAVPHILDEGKYIALEEQVIDSLEDGSVYVYPSGGVDIYDTKSSQLVKTLNFPSQSLILFFANYPDYIYPLGLSVNGVVRPIDIDSLLGESNSSLNVNLIDSKGHNLVGGDLQYYDNGWKNATNNGDGTFGINTTKSTLSLRMTYEYASQSVSNVPAQNNTYTFQTVNAAVQLQNSQGNLIDQGTVQYYAGAWRDFGATVNGIVTKELLPNSYSFRMTYAYSSNDKQQNIGDNPTVVFQTVNAAVQLQNSQGSLIDQGTVQYYAGAWRDFGTTVNRVATKELLPNSYSFRMTYSYSSNDKQQNIGDNPTVVFQTVNAAVQLQNSQGSLIDQGTVQYYAGAWRDFGTTANGVAAKELLPNNYSFRMTYEYISNDKQQNVGSDPTVIFSTVLCTIKVSNQQGPLNNADVKYYSGAWRSIGLTTNGEIAKELLPKNIIFRANFGSVQQDKTQDISVNNIVEILLNTGE